MTQTKLLTDHQLIELSAYEYKIDNDIRTNTFYFYDLCILRLKEQIALSKSIYNTILKDAIDLNTINHIETDVDKKTYAKIMQN